MSRTRPKKSKGYDIGGSKYSFDFADGKIIGIRKSDESGQFGNSLENEYLNPRLSNFGDIAANESALEAYNLAKHGGNTDEYESSIAQATSAELQDYFNEQDKKAANKAAIATEENLRGTFYGTKTPSRHTEGVYGREYSFNKKDDEVYAYPSDISTDQDHLKIQKWEYVRPNVNQSKPNQGVAKQDANVAGDSVKGSKLQGSVLLPMPKVVDVNGADWGENKITAFGLGALGASKVAADVLNLTPGLTEKERTSNLEALNKLKGEGQFGSGFGSKEERENFRKALGSAASVSVTSGIAGLAGNALGTQISPDTFLARTGGAVLNPNAEMLFQGPVIRDFNFSFLMIARSEKEGSEIRKIIKWFKKGMAPKFRNTTLIKSPDIFTLEYKNAGGLLKTVNRFNPGGLALTTINVDYAPSGYWSAYRDSQPVALKMDLNFTELRPIYQKDQEDDDKFRGFDSVGF